MLDKKFAPLRDHALSERYSFSFDPVVPANAPFNGSLRKGSVVKPIMFGRKYGLTPIFRAQSHVLRRVARITAKLNQWVLPDGLLGRFGKVIADIICRYKEIVDMIDARHTRTETLPQSTG